MGLLSSDVEKIEIKFDQVVFELCSKKYNDKIFVLGWETISSWRCGLRNI